MKRFRAPIMTKLVPLADRTFIIEGIPILSLWRQGMVVSSLWRRFLTFGITLAVAGGLTLPVLAEAASMIHPLSARQGTGATPVRDPTLSQTAGFESWWAMTHRPTTAWSGTGDGAVAFGEIPQWRYLQAVGAEEDGRVPAVDPRTGALAHVDILALGPVGAPPEEYFEEPPPDSQAINLPGRIVGTVDTYERPTPRDYFSLERLAHNHAVTVEASVEGADGNQWYRIGSEYVPSQRVRLPQPPERTWSGRWIDANLTEPTMVTAYEGDRPVYAALAVKGGIAYQTPTGVYSILRRVQNETMDSATIGIPRDHPLGYYLKDVLFTQYFTWDGAALHYNYWRSDWGAGGSKGCLGMNLADSTFFWEFARVGTVVYIHY